MEWKPAGEQEDVFARKPPAPTNPNIVLTKLRPGQGVEMELHAVKGVGKDHAKFSPVGTIILERCWEYIPYHDTQRLPLIAFFQT